MAFVAAPDIPGGESIIMDADTVDNRLVPFFALGPDLWKALSN